MTTAKQQPPQAEPDWLKLQDLLPSLADGQSQSSYYPNEVLEKARRSWIMRHIKAGWRFVSGFMEKGEGGRKVTAQVGFDMPGPFPGDTNFNPKTDAYAVHMGAEFRSDNRYWHEARGLWLDRNGSILLPPQPPWDKPREEGPPVQGVDWECPECGGAPWHVLVNVTPPGAAVRKYQRVPCSRCVSREEIEEARRRREAYSPTMPPRGRN